MNPPRSSLLIVLVLVAGFAGGGVLRARQGPAPRPAQPLTVVSTEDRRPLPVSQLGDQLMVALEDLAALFQVTVREDTVSGGLSVTRQTKSVLLTPGQSLVSASGRLVSLPAPVTRDGKRWLVPVEFISRALSLILDTRLEVRRNSRLVLVGDVRVPRVDVREQAAGANLRLTVTVAPRAGHLITHEGNQLLVRFEADALDATLPSVAPTPVLQGVRIGDPATVLALDLGPRFGSYRASAVTRESNSEIVIELMPAAPATPGIPVPTPPPAALEPLPQVAPLGWAPIRTVVIDAGHGGEEHGAPGASGTTEKEIALAVALRLKAVLEGRLGLRVLMTRDHDEAAPLDGRAALANNNKADLFLSLHANASLRRDVKGAQVYYLGADPTGEDARRASLAGQSLPTLSGGTRDVEMILWEMAQVRHIGESAAFAGMLEEELRGRVEMNPHPILQGPFRVLAAVNMPAVLVELGFLSNPEEEKQLRSPEHQDRLVQALLQAIVRMRDARERGFRASVTR